jgi:hypothetical protein
MDKMLQSLDVKGWRKGAKYGYEVSIFLNIYQPLLMFTTLFFSTFLQRGLFILGEDTYYQYMRVQVKI